MTFFLILFERRIVAVVVVFCITILVPHTKSSSHCFLITIKHKSFTYVVTNCKYLVIFGRSR